MHHSKTIDQTTEDARKPEIITFYNSSKGGVDVVDEMCATYSAARKTNRWPLTAFFNLLNVVGVNAFVVSSCNNPEDQRLVRRIWLKELAKELVSPFMRSRLQIMNLPKLVRLNILQILQKNEAPVPEDNTIEAGPRKRKRCGLCPRTGNKTHHVCPKCQMYICGNHGTLVCRNCLGNV